MICIFEAKQNTMDTFAGISTKHNEYDSAKSVLIPVPYDGTSTWIKGADKGPKAFLEAAMNMELFDIETDSEAYLNGIHLSAPINEATTPESMSKAVKAKVLEYLKDEKFITLIGGEHSISIGSIQAFEEKYDDLTVIQLDAHADLRPEYEGSKYNHACAMHWASQNCNLIQIGIRSMDKSEKAFLNPNQCFFAHNIDSMNNNWMEKVISLCTENVYITIDLDAFDPSIMPSTGTPEPGGLSWNQVVEFCKQIITRKNVKGFDIVELCPNKHNKAPDFLAAKLYYKLLSYQFSKI